MPSWQQIEIAGRPVEAWAPIGRPRFGLLFLPDFDAPSPLGGGAYDAWLELHGIACLCPLAGRTFWTDRHDVDFHPVLTAERYLLEALLPDMQSRWSLPDRGIGLSGFGIGGQGALRLAFRHPLRFPAVGAIAPALEFQEWYYADTPLMELYSSKEHCRQDTAALHIHPTEFPPHIHFCIDPDDRTWYRGVDRLHEKLQALGVAHTCDLDTRGGGHTLEYLGRMWEPALRPVVRGLEKESRRLL